MVCLQNRLICGFLISTSATKMLKEVAFYSIGLLRTLMSFSFSFLYKRSSTSRVAILFPLRFRYSSYSSGGSSSSIFSTLFRRRCSFLIPGIVSQPERAVTMLLPIYSSSSFGIAFSIPIDLNLLSMVFRMRRVGCPVHPSLIFSSLCNRWLSTQVLPA